MMANRKGKSNRELNAKLVNEADKRIPCAFCNREVDDEVIYGKLYAIGSIQIHYFCALLSCCLIQKAKDTVGLFGFLYSDILAEIERSKKHKCSYCGRGGANLGCSVSQCRKQFHLPCGREKNAVSMFFGNYKSFCQQHAPKQKIPDNIMANVKLRKQKKTDTKITDETVANTINTKCEEACDSSDSTVCVICYETVYAGPSNTTFWPPCCGSDAWFHRTCLQRMALTAGKHYLKCPLCNDKCTFQQAVVEQGYYMPDRDAAWELEQNAFAEIYERPISCCMETCLCPEGRGYDSDQGEWDIRLCLLCGTQSAHARCNEMRERFVCAVCEPAAPADMDALAEKVQAVIAQEQSRTQASRRQPVMPSRMSLRRTKQRMTPIASTSSASNTRDKTEPLTNTELSRLELNLKTPKPLHNIPETTPLTIENNLNTPLKLLDEGIKERLKKMHVRDNFWQDLKFVEIVRQKFNKPRPLSAKRRIINELLEELFNNLSKESSKCKEPLKEWSSPDKLQNYFENSAAAPPLCTVPSTPKKDLQETTIPNDDIVFLENEKNPETDPNSSGEVICLDDEEESSSSFELPPEFIGEESDYSNSILIPDQQPTTIVDIRKDSSLEISELDESVKIDVITIADKTPETNTEQCLFKFSPVDNETLWNKNVNLDVECFKKKYMSEVNKDDIKNEVSNPKDTLKTESEDGVMKRNKHKSLKRKLDMNRPKKDKNKENTKKLKSQKHKMDKLKTKLSVHDKSIKLKIRIKEKQFRLKISEKKCRKKRTEGTSKKLQQYVLQYDSTAREHISKPSNDVTPMKKKKTKHVKTPDNFVQTSIQSFFLKNPKN